MSSSDDVVVGGWREVDENGVPVGDPNEGPPPAGSVVWYQLEEGGPPHVAFTPEDAD